ncbi:alpha/beta fold hydrolase [Inquilinus limosus]|uniref:2-succinyl-6-hydroxy-2, 4-cyclohexadiene-1-carboxylate synthase n=1 Tax=Inquilinus limosus MP06 TaxID=1398085 RepID=A0A0A0D4P7_9PROT|nr:alpha/beta fold hydrolase [Inquilinus limosus]KGM32037.1 2-succinyl-6-hydroxy-2,4-cyclohexadiene-1-carboxylate synthase [Inquilinus limosus MP06]
MPFAEIDDQSLHYIDQGSGFPVLLGHSYLWDSGMWAPQIEALSQRYRVIAPDLWGHGRSGRLPAETDGLPGLARQALALLDTLRIERFAVIGHSVGGMWGAELALQAPDRVASLVLMNTSLLPEPAASRAQYTALMDQIEAIGALPGPMLDIIVPLYFRPGLDPASPLPAGLRQSLAGLSAERLRESVIPLGRIIFGRPDGRERLRGLDPERTLLVCGAQDQPRPPAETEEMAGIIGCRFVTVPDAGHVSGLENPDFVNRTLIAELERQLADD